MIRMSLSCLAALALAGCQPGDGGEPEEAAETPAAMPNAAGSPTPTSSPTARPDSEEGEAEGITAAELTGEYRIAGVDGGDINLPHGITASIGADRIDVTSGCVEMAWSYRLEGAGLTTTSIPVVTCDRGRYPEEEAIAAAFSAAREVERTASNGLRFSGGGRSVTLFSQ